MAHRVRSIHGRDTTSVFLPCLGCRVLGPAHPAQGTVASNGEPLVDAAVACSPMQLEVPGDFEKVFKPYLSIVGDDDASLEPMSLVEAKKALW